MSQLRTALGQDVQAAVGEPLAAIDHHCFQSQAHIGGVLAQPVGQDSDGAVGMQQLSREPDGAPQPGIPCQVVPAAAHASASTELVGWEVGEDLKEGVVGEQVDRGIVVGFGLSRAGVDARLRVDHGHRLSMGGRRG